MWMPGKPVITQRDHEEWTLWRRQRKNELQRQRRANLARIDYYPSKTAQTVIDSLRAPYVDCDASSILNRIVAEWLEAISGASGIK